MVSGFEIDMDMEEIVSSRQSTMDSFGSRSLSAGRSLFVVQNVRETDYMTCVCPYVAYCIKRVQAVLIKTMIYIYILIYIYGTYHISNLGNSRFAKRTSTNLGRSHRLPHICTRMMYGKIEEFRGYRWKENDVCAQVWHHVKRGNSIWMYLGRSQKTDPLFWVQFLNTNVRL